LKRCATNNHSHVKLNVPIFNRMYNLKITIRRLLKDKAFAGLNLFGLVIGISSFLILFIYVSNEKSFDKHFKDHEKIYRVISNPVGRDITKWARSGGIIYKASSEIPEVQLATQFSHCPTGTIKIGENSLQQKDIMAVDEAFLEMFEVKSKVGNLSEITLPNAVFVSEAFARKHYGNLNPLGQTIKIESLQYLRNLGDYEIRGIVKNTKPKTHFKYELLLSQKGGLQERFETLPNQKIAWTYNYYKLHENANPDLIEEKVKAYYDQSSLKQAPGPKEFDFTLFPMNDIHLKSDFRFELLESSSKINIRLFVLISFVILLVSLLNFTNLNIAKLIKRSKELGLKKSIGANPYQLLSQVLSEVLLLCVLATGISLLTIESIMPLINNLFEIEFDIYYTDPVVYLSILSVISTSLILTSLFVTAFLLKRNSAIEILSEQNNFSGSAVLKSLLVVQVTIIIVLISGTFMVNKQVDFILNKPLGFEKENVVVLHVKDRSIDPAVFVRELKKQSYVASVGMTAQHFGYPAQGIPLDGMGIEGTAEFVFANYDYLKTMNIKLIQNWINPKEDTVSGMVVNNHLYNRLMERHGSMENLLAYQAAQPMESGQVRINYVGVAEDFNYSSAHESIGDFAFWLDESRNRARFIHVRLNPGNLRASMDILQKTWQTHYQGQEFSYFFIDEKIAQQYKAETIVNKYAIPCFFPFSVEPDRAHVFPMDDILIFFCLPTKLL